MKGWIFVLFCFLPVLIFGEIETRSTGKTGVVEELLITIREARAESARELTIVNSSEKNPKKVVWIFHGFKPKGDSYQQGAGFFIRNWMLSQLAIEEKLVVIIPDLDDGIFALRPQAGPGIPVIRWLDFLNRQKILPEYGNAPVILIGVSSGAESAMKFYQTSGQAESMILLSGTYDLFSLPKDSGEYNLHKIYLNPDPTGWTAENPVDFLKDSPGCPIYLFSEEKSIFQAQALCFLELCPKQFTVTHFLELGTGFTHSWKFWANPPVQKEIRNILTK